MWVLTSVEVDVRSIFLYCVDRILWRNKFCFRVLLLELRFESTSSILVALYTR